MTAVETAPPEAPPAVSLSRIGSMFSETAAGHPGLTWAMNDGSPVREAIDAEQAAYASRRSDPDWQWLYGHWGEAICGAAPEPEPVLPAVTGPLYRDELIRRSGYELPPGGSRRAWPAPGQEALPRFVPADDTSVDLPAIGELDEEATGQMTRFMEAHDALGDGDDR